MNQPRERIGFNGGAIAIIGLCVILAAVAVALAADSLGLLVGALAVIGVIIVLSLAAISLIVRFAAPPIVGIGNIRLEALREQNRHEEVLLKEGGIWRELPGYKVINQIEAPREQGKQAQVEIDPRYDLLVNLCLLTIKSAKYGPTSRRLMTADDAQGDRSGMFTDRSKSWEPASKYGQEKGLLFVQRGGNDPDEQGLKIKCGKGDTAADLLVVLHEINQVRDSAVAALPGMTR